MYVFFIFFKILFYELYQFFIVLLATLKEYHMRILRKLLLNYLL
jgi:hypothetical protein